MSALARNRVIVGDALTELRRLPSAVVDCVITSPPYFGLRDYQAAGQLGLEASVGEWVGHLAAVADELARVLKPTGSLWLNLGDSYSRKPGHGAPAKGLVLAPERLLLALASRGWLVRNKVVWAKPNPMPMSARDRLTCSWEPVYLLVRSPRYFFDLDSIREPHTSQRSPSRQHPMDDRPPAWAGPLAGNQSGLQRLHRAGIPGHPLGKNPADVWRVPTAAGRDGHHATFPEALVRRPLLASCPERTCRRCGGPWRRGTFRTIGHLAVTGELTPACDCQAAWQPGLVLDPFLGSGTTAVAAARHRRDWLGIELNPAFAAHAAQRVKTVRIGDGAQAA